MKEKLKIFMGSSMRLAPISFLVACKVQSNNDDEILFKAFQGLPRPLMQTLTRENRLVTYYKKFLKNDQDFLALKSQVNQENPKKLKKLEQKFLQEINVQQNKKGISVKQTDSSKIHWNPYLKTLNLRNSVIFWLKSMLNFLKSQNTRLVLETKNKSIAQIFNKIEDVLGESTQLKNPMITKVNKILEQLTIV
ncbi:hypothetical protein R7X12_01825 [Mesomycoplasma ovipneumoniae]|uniref:hypothetical protein n=1 Tax=Mesomycoplasma ovipneumoniae TaxID=29562 RepID=UPI002964FEE8|nr:hypothetical protein [Mesomycoplasma ovipneumoniae]MDW2913642.1 hypothetical protein [Mesomycoplasma ovipneumoniae]MDW2915862.1 hypothetical protein [Mesomycoplasma ovipneumoniae]MDW2919244.1 hypothetical protein [Mesomycoplasma ovipneumoniae]